MRDADGRKEEASNGYTNNMTVHTIVRVHLLETT